jgi:predicted hydrocarbon binding protein
MPATPNPFATSSSELTFDPVAELKRKDDRIDVGNALKITRPTLGDNAGIALYRLLRLVALEDIIGRGAAGTAYLAGKKLGHSLGLTKLEDFLQLCADLKIGIIEVPVLTDSRIHVDVYECVTCSGLETVGRSLCHFEGGLIAGVSETVLKRRVRAHEVTCIGGLGDDACGFDLEFR